ncbi:MAG: 3-oxoacyl-[acyl-carrier-protein] reductase [Bacteroidia bacterium]|nr:MAG: 3-oxoacyl-[acyl-carrier-protein] reductase [Bacteroidia bacterium]
MKLLEGKTALITGGSRGIGKAIAIAFARHGAHVAFSDLVYDDLARELEKELQALGVKSKGYASDASKFDDSEVLLKEVVDSFGQIDILVNNAGITRDTLLMRMTEEMWDDVIRVNLKSAFNLTKATQKYMLKQRSGCIINMSSIVGIGGNAGQANYAASKAGMIGFTKSVAQEIGARNIRVNAIAPGFIETEMTARLPEDVKKEWAEKIPLKRAGQPEDVAGMAVFLASDLAAYVTGQVFTVCGGMNQ